MVEGVRAVYLGNEILAAAVTTGLESLIRLKERVDTAFAHAKTRTRRLCEAAQYASDFVQLFEGTIDELRNVFDGPRAKLLRTPLEKLQRAVKNAEKTVAELEGKSKAKWFMLGDTYRAQLTKATQDVSTQN